MAWKFDNPLYSLADQDQNRDAKGLWEREALGGITEDNNRLPVPVVGLLVLTIIAAFMITFPLWGQRPSAALYEEYINLMDNPQVQAMANDEDRMNFIVDTVKAKGSEWQPLLERHPLTMDDLRLIKDQVVELQRQNAHLQEYTVLGNRLVLANFEGNVRDDGSVERIQPWWDKGYTIDVFYIIAFCLAVIIVVKRLPEYSWQPTHKGH